MAKNCYFFLLSDWLKRVKGLVEEVVKSTSEYLQTELREVQKGLVSFQYSTNYSPKSVYKDKERDVELMLAKLENYSVQNNVTQPTKNLPWKIIILVSLTAVLAIVVAVVIRNKVRKS